MTDAPQVEPLTAEEVAELEAVLDELDQPPGREANWTSWRVWQADAVRVSQRILDGRPLQAELDFERLSFVAGDRPAGEAAERLSGIAEAWAAGLRRELGRHRDALRGGFITVVEARQLEVVVEATARVIHEHKLDPEAASLLQAAVDTINAQTRSARPDRGIIGRSLRTIATHAGALLLGVGGNYLTDLLKAFPQVPWPS